MVALLSIYFAGALLGVFVVAAIFVIENPLDLALADEGRAVLGVIAGLLWPLVALYAIVRFLCAAWRGVMQCVRLVVPAKAKLPRAEVRR
jgi:hypothetical protein